MMLLKLKNTVNPINDTENNTGKDFEDLTIGTNEEEKMEYIGDETPRGSVFALDVKRNLFLKDGILLSMRQLVILPYLLLKK